MLLENIERAAAFFCIKFACVSSVIPKFESSVTEINNCASYHTLNSFSVLKSICLHIKITHKIYQNDWNVAGVLLSQNQIHRNLHFLRLFVCALCIVCCCCFLFLSSLFSYFLHMYCHHCDDVNLKSLSFYSYFICSSWHISFAFFFSSFFHLIVSFE